MAILQRLRDQASSFAHADIELVHATISRYGSNIKCNAFYLTNNDQSHWRFDGYSYYEFSN